MASWTQDTKARQQRTRMLWVLPLCATRCLVLNHVKVSCYFLELVVSWQPHLGNYDNYGHQFCLVETVDLFNIIQDWLIIASHLIKCSQVGTRSWPCLSSH